MHKWEYIFVKQIMSPLGGGVYVISSDGKKKKHGGKDLDGTSVIKLINQLGDSGWDIACVGSTGTNAGIFTMTWTLKRQTKHIYRLLATFFL